MTVLNVLSFGFLPTVSFDQAYGDRELRAAADALVKRGDWRPARDLLLASDGDWAAKDHRVQYLSDRATGKAVLREWVEAEPESGDPLAVLSRAEVARAWAVRGARRAKYVQKSAWPTFFEILGQADELAALAGDLAPNDPTSRATSVLIARGLQVSRHEFDARWDALVARDPLHWTGHRQALQYLCAKWFGSHKEMFEFARNAAERAPAGHPLVVLPLLANLEMRLADGNVGLGSALFGTDLAQVQERWIEAGPELHPRVIADRSLVAFYLSRLERRSEAAAQFRAMGRCASTSGWQYTLFPRQAFLRDRAAALRLLGTRQ
ncbi:hypothetical protein ACGF12_01590 [Kitasatospora sp. NPDC048296]|uniref:hypothetical protein n=1 Tax=Kitasatospora sp. NPDC048296 TaxID=3364048 RepID=UPI003712AF3B